MNTNIYKHQWEVPSTTKADKMYKVSEKHTGEFVCSCPHNIFRKKTCEHIKMISDFEEVRRQAEYWINRVRRYGINKLA